MKKLFYILFCALLATACTEVTIDDDDIQVYEPISSTASLSEFSAYSYPESENTWVVTDYSADIYDLSGLSDALIAVVDREISLEFPNMEVFPSSISFEIAPFRYCTSLVSVSLPQATEIGSWVFFECQSIETIYAPKLNYIGEYAFYMSESIKTIECSSELSVGEYAFYYCINLESIAPESPIVTSSGTQSVGDYAFYECDLLETFPTSALASIGYAGFRDCHSINGLDFSSLTYLGAHGLYDCLVLDSFSAPLLTELNDSALRGCAKVVSVTLPKVHSLYYDSLTKCKGITSISLATDEGVVLTFVDEGAFEGSNSNTKLESITLTLGAISTDFSVDSNTLSYNDYSFEFNSIIYEK